MFSEVDFYRKTLLDLENQLSEIKLFIKKEKDCLQNQEKVLSEEVTTVIVFFIIQKLGRKQYVWNWYL